MKELTGMEVALGVGQAPLQQQFTVGEQTVAGGPAYGLTPWFKLTDTGAEVMGRYTSDGSISMAKKRFGTGNNAYTVVHAAAPAVPLTVWRALSEAAGVHHFAGAGDSVEANGNLVMLHASSDGARRVAFPGTMAAIDEIGLAGGERTACTSCSFLDGVAFQRGDTRVWRWRGP